MNIFKTLLVFSKKENATEFANKFIDYSHIAINTVKVCNNFDEFLATAKFDKSVGILVFDVENNDDISSLLELRNATKLAILSLVKNKEDGEISLKSGADEFAVKHDTTDEMFTMLLKHVSSKKDAEQKIIDIHTKLSELENLMKSPPCKE